MKFFNPFCFDPFASSGGGSATLIEKSITENGEYNASVDNADGYSKVTVNVAGGGGETFEVEVTFDENLKPTVNKTYIEMKAAIDAGKSIVGVMTLEYIPDGSVQLSGGYYTPNFTYQSQDFGECIILISKPCVITAYQTTSVINLAILKDAPETIIAIAYGWG